ncbi:MAG TPA: hypothetical protein VN539_08710, partial [Candidatus Saccharimonadales bacterium]|nr:hypothetical protein [Candidatus Saccharimonadales bacterium]
MTSVPILLHGANGRMGRAVRSVIAEFPETRLAVCVSRAKSEDASGAVWISPGELLAKGDATVPKDAVVLDVSLAEGTERLLTWLERSPRALVSATTGLGEEAMQRIGALAQRAPVLREVNLS